MRGIFVVSRLVRARDAARDDSQSIARAARTIERDISTSPRSHPPRRGAGSRHGPSAGPCPPRALPRPGRSAELLAVGQSAARLRAARGVEGARIDTGGDAAVFGALVPELLAPGAAPSAAIVSGSDLEARYRLFEATINLLRVASAAPLIIAL